MVTLGVDEVGRGCLAGPVVAAAVILDKKIYGLKDSKKLSKKTREKLAARIHEKAASVGIGWVDAAVVDAKGLTFAVRSAMEQVVEQISLNYDELIIDGNYNFLRTNQKARTLIKADDKVKAVSAASIVAKVARDNYMAEQAQRFPGYGFEQHVGYATNYHLSQLQVLGECLLHRKSYKTFKLQTESEQISLTIEA